MDFELNFHILLEPGNIYAICTNKRFKIKPWDMKQIFGTVDIKFKLKYVCVRGELPHPSTLRLNALLTWIKFLTSIFNSRSYWNLFRKIWIKPRLKGNVFNEFWIVLYNTYNFFTNRIVSFKLNLLKLKKRIVTKSNLHLNWSQISKEIPSFLG